MHRHKGAEPRPRFPHPCLLCIKPIRVFLGGKLEKEPKKHSGCFFFFFQAAILTKITM